MLSASAALHAQSQAAVSYPVPDLVLELWPDGAPTDNGLSGDEIDYGNHVSNVTEPTLSLFLPEGECNGLAIISCPGGGYIDVWDKTEGYSLADWYNEMGIVYAVLKYRLPNGHREVPLDDVHNVFRYCREHAGEWGIDQIGVMGFSAGGHLAASATTLYTDKVTRPDFSILIYPVIAMDNIPSHAGSKVNLIGKDEVWTSTEGKTADEWLKDQELHKDLIRKYSLYQDVTTDTPPVFLTHCSDDPTVPVVNSIVFYNALKEKGHNPEMHIFPYGGHGWGFSSAKFVKKDKFGYARGEFENSLSRWLESVRADGK